MATRPILQWVSPRRHEVVGLLINPSGNRGAADGLDNLTHCASKLFAYAQGISLADFAGASVVCTGLSATPCQRRTSIAMTADNSTRRSTLCLAVADCLRVGLSLTRLAMRSSIESSWIQRNGTKAMIEHLPALDHSSFRRRLSLRRGRIGVPCRRRATPWVTRRDTNRTCRLCKNRTTNQEGHGECAKPTTSSANHLPH